MRTPILLAALPLLALLSCQLGPRYHLHRDEPPPAPDPEPVPEPGPRPRAASAPVRGESIVVCGELVPIGAPVVLWTEPGGYDASRTGAAFPDEAGPDAPVGLRYTPGRPPREDGGGGVLPGGGREALPSLRERVDQLVLHYDVAGTSRQCFKVLHDRRKLSVHFLLDLDGTLYQTLDLADTAWHAGRVNPRSIGVEIASIGAYAPGPSPLDAWYERDARGVRVRLPPERGDGGVRTPGFVARPARQERLRATIQGQALEMHDFTPEQHRTLVRLAAALTRTFPRLRPDAPRRPGGGIWMEVLPDAELEAFGGILGHFHVSPSKVDPGPALDWEPFLAAVRARRGELEP